MTANQNNLCQRCCGLHAIDHHAFERDRTAVARITNEIGSYLVCAFCAREAEQLKTIWVERLEDDQQADCD